MLDILVAILALLFGADTPAQGAGMDDRVPMCEDTAYVAPCVFIHDDNPWLSDADGSVTILRYV